MYAFVHGEDILTNTASSHKSECNGPYLVRNRTEISTNELLLILSLDRFSVWAAYMESRAPTTIFQLVQMCSKLFLWYEEFLQHCYRVHSHGQSTSSSTYDSGKKRKFSDGTSSSSNMGSRTTEGIYQGCMLIVMFDRMGSVEYLQPGLMMALLQMCEVGCC